MTYNWVPALGEFEMDADTVVFKGGTSKGVDGRPVPNIGNFISNQRFGGGVLTAEIQFVSGVQDSACEFILYYQPLIRAFITAGLGAGALCSVRTFAGQWITLAVVGDRAHLKPNRDYRLKATVAGSHVAVTLDGIDILAVNLPFPLPLGQAGLWCMGSADIRVAGFTVTPERPKAFIVMQFTPPYNELYTDVVKPVCEEMGLCAPGSASVLR